jgi:hypothetical protein
LCAIEGIGGPKADIGSGSFGLLPHGAFSLLKSRFWPSDFSPKSVQATKNLDGRFENLPFLRLFSEVPVKNFISWGIHHHRAPVFGRKNKIPFNEKHGNGPLISNSPQTAQQLPIALGIPPCWPARFFV